MTAVDRRALLKSALLLIGAAAGAAPDWAFAQGQTPRFFGPEAFALLDEVCELIVPRTDTPGARDAGVPRVIDGLMADWASDATKRDFSGLLADIDAGARRDLGKPLAAAAGPARLEFMRAYDARAFANREPRYLRLKELVLTLYYLSEAGATQELRYEHSPGAWEPWTPAGPDTRAWAV